MPAPRAAHAVGTRGQKGPAHSFNPPPPRRCAELWRPRLLAELPKVELTLLVGGYAQAWALGAAAKANMTETVRAWRDYAPAILPLPHPSWRNTAWLKKNPWFEAEDRKSVV